MTPIIAPSLLSADFARLGEAVEMVARSEASWVHLDVMDGHFVPNLTFGPPVIKAIRPYTRKVFDVHLMISHPDDYLEAFKDAGADYLSVHYESCIHLQRTLVRIRQLGMKAGLALNPHTPVSAVREIATEIDLLLIMSVNPGFGGQKFIPRTLARINEANKLQEETNASFLIEVDGGVTLENAPELLKAGVDVLVAGNTVFSADDPLAMIAALRSVPEK
jgi:ribulose-phosphate 3-epimerase